MVVSIVMQPFPQSNSRIFSSLQKETSHPRAVIHHSSSVSTTSLLSVSMALCILDSSYTKNCAICGPLGLASSTQLLLFKVHPQWYSLSILRFFLWPYSITLQEYIRIHLLIRLLMDVWFVSMFWLL